MFYTIGQLLRSWFFFFIIIPRFRRLNRGLCTENSYGVKIPGFIDALNFYAGEWKLLKQKTQ